MGRSLRIAVWYNLPSGGAKRALYEHIKGMKAHGHDVEVWRPPVPNARFGDIAELVPEHEIPLADFTSVSPSRLGRFKQFAAKTERMTRAFDAHCRAVAQEIHSREFDLLFAGNCMVSYAPFIGRYVGLPSLLYLNDPARHFYEAMPVSSWLGPDANERRIRSPRAVKRRILDWVRIENDRRFIRAEWENANSFNQILCNSAYSRESMMRAYGIAAQVCYLGIDTARFTDLQLPREDLVISVGSFHHMKGGKLIIQAIAQLPEPRPRLLWICNFVDPNYHRESIELAQRLGVDFGLAEMVPDDELVQWLNRAKLMAYAPRLEPFGLAPLEANACATPVVGIAEGGVRETVLDGVNGLIADAAPGPLATAIHTVLSDDRKWAELSANALRLARDKWSIEAANERLEAVLQAFIADPPQLTSVGYAAHSHAQGGLVP